MRNCGACSCATSGCSRSWRQPLRLEGVGALILAWFGERRNLGTPELGAMGSGSDPDQPLLLPELH